MSPPENSVTQPPDESSLVSSAGALVWQAGFCRDHGAPIAAAVCDAVAGDLDAEGVTSGLFPSHTRPGDWLGLRVLGLVHRLAIRRHAPAVAVHAPTLGGTSPFAARAPDAAVAAFGDAVVDAVAGHPDDTAEALARIPQTNEVGRARALRVALSRSGLPVRLFELGASAGLNLRADHLPGETHLEAGPLPRIVERRGCDLNPLDPTRAADREWLSSFVWMDDTDRFAALAGALKVAGRVPVTVERTDAATFVGTLKVMDGATTVVWHSAVWPYFTPDTQHTITGRLAALGASATANAPLWQVWWEPTMDDPGVFELVVRQWTGSVSGPTTRVLARGDAHCRSMEPLDVSLGAGDMPWVG